MMREHSYMEMSLRGSELGKCESYGNWRNLCVLVGTRTQKQKFGRCVTFSDKIRRCRSGCSSVGVRQCGCGGGCIQQDGRSASGSVKLDRRIARS